MRKLWILTLILLWPACADAREDIDWMQDVFGCTGKTCTIYESKGGIVDRFEEAAKEARKKRVQIRIDGQCASSCVVFASQVRDQVCLTGNARMGIHMGYTKFVYDPEGKEVLPNLRTGENVHIFEFPPEGYTEEGVYVDLPYGKDILTWAKANDKMPATPGAYFMTESEAFMFWKACE